MEYPVHLIHPICIIEGIINEEFNIFPNLNINNETSHSKSLKNKKKYNYLFYLGKEIARVASITTFYD